jgi:anthranilate phosphoribosyltransferase
MIDSIVVTKEELIEASRDVYDGMSDKDVYDIAVVPVGAVLVIAGSVNIRDGAKMLEYCLENRARPEIKAIMELALIHLCKVTDLTVQEVIKTRRVCISN